MRIGDVEIGGKHPCRTVAELSNSHNGKLSLALQLIEEAKAAGADLVKIQAYTPQELVRLRGDGPAPEPWGSQGYTMSTLYEKAQTPLEWIPKLFNYAKAVGIPLFSSVFGPTSLAALEAVNCPAYKISHFEADKNDFIRAVETTGKPLIVSSAKRWGTGADFIGNAWMLYCPGGYPAKASDMNLTKLNGVQWLGLSSHCKDPLVAPIAVARWAKLLEFHFMSDDEPSQLESNVSLTGRQFRSMVQSVRRAEELIG